jgi:hypothetical protein
MERREARGVCETPVADLAIDPPEHHANKCTQFAPLECSKAFARLAIDALAFRRSIAVFFGFRAALACSGCPARLSELLAHGP